MLPTGITLADFELRVVLAILALALVLAGGACWWRQSRGPARNAFANRPQLFCN